MATLFFNGRVTPADHPPSLPDLTRRTAALGYGLQALLTAESPPHTHLWLLGSTGAQVQERWRAGRSAATLLAENRAAPPHSPGPLDAFCREELGALLGDRPHRFLFPHDPRETLYPLLALLQTAGLHRPSPLMQTLHPRYGSWWAVRTVVALTATEAEVDGFVSTALGEDPCRGCTAPCVTACPVGAVTLAGWEWMPCVGERLREGSACAHACGARNACPAGAAYRYPEAVQAYHYGVSLDFLKQAGAVVER